ncbi:MULTISPECIES: acetyl-CoA carboxylase biotin carboxyl carrier protein subunit [Aneurinibacillus]|jgi:acetyl-CoA carboxylase biotin carboxyl carrier protein|uniref:Acetyl-CoA carboxylase biotin carboxyl carrier protein subunit n=1 Tax=Aneurinibacillus thermoaerophilus TaxID=143495 RepID=A0ABX8Y850_ANETH|nr:MULTISPECIES: acetyl-CoA carboxylase biotin carboxyl carrier protein subunit [Aneurinibacillus]AMA72559.1 acetyl-CoA carboxylase biotin carboxyl carrier protein subunit [Aneurinibacillus sp. XH2]MED0674737.1 acetyl-CoA carboxylase biotin carboxyl carrier protein subunit [Aneurinibacillus thermoaerophilus]MED0736831.1 acetyl-CoA carboxylase biotin carboxyl carrier protein subunit [Aneurinibacillus thermoaerophilus]QYY41691.1 acetyl-CoA carboxylase biotin carboxyl carrier protein subunit [Aneu
MKQVIANMAGTVISVLVNTGDEVQAGSDVVMIESMKMEVPVAAEVSGKVKVVKVNPGDFVNEGDVLIELEG